MEKMEKMEKEVLLSIEEQMKSYQFAETNMILKYKFLISMPILLLCMCVVYSLHPYFDKYFDKMVVMIFVSISINLYLASKLMYSERARVELKVLNHKLSNLYDSYKLNDITLLHLKYDTEHAVDFYIKNGKNVFLNYSPYNKRNR
jgi:hypothetical protein